MNKNINRQALEEEKKKMADEMRKLKELQHWQQQVMLQQLQKQQEDHDARTKR